MYAAYREAALAASISHFFFPSTLAPLAASLALENDFFFTFFYTPFFSLQVPAAVQWLPGAAVAASLGLDNAFFLPFLLHSFFFFAGTGSCTVAT